MATSGTGAIITEGEAYKYGHIYLSSSSTKALTYGKMVDNANVYSSSGVTTVRSFAGGWITDDMRSTSSVTPPAINRYKCVKYSDLYDKVVRVPWNVKIAENVSGATRAHTIELRYYYKLTSSSTETYKVIGTWDYGSNISGSASTTHYFECNPYLILGSATTPYYAYLAIWCGTTNNKQTWYYKLRRGGSWDSSYTQAASSATSVLITYNKNTSNVGNTNFLATMGYLSGVEFYID